MTPGRKIMNLRLDHGWKQQELAERVGLAGSWISKLERDEEVANDADLKRIAKALGVTTCYLLDETKLYPPGR